MRRKWIRRMIRIMIRGGGGRSETDAELAVSSGDLGGGPLWQATSTHRLGVAVITEVGLGFRSDQRGADARRSRAVLNIEVDRRDPSRYIFRSFSVGYRYG